MQREADDYLAQIAQLQHDGGGSSNGQQETRTMAQQISKLEAVVRERGRTEEDHIRQNTTLLIQCMLVWRMQQDLSILNGYVERRKEEDNVCP